MLSFFAKVTIFCFAASYAVALLLEAWHTFRPRPIHRLLALGFGLAGFLGHTIFLIVHPLSLARPDGSLLFLAWILAVFYLYGSIHHARFAWGMFVLPVMLGMILLGSLTGSEQPTPSDGFFLFRGEKFWGATHGAFLLLAAVGIAVAAVASLMYLVQVHRLKAKIAPGHGMKMLSLERLESMNRRAILWAFPFLTAGLLTGIVLQLQRGSLTQGWDSVKILSTLGLWLVFAILLFLRYASHIRGRQVALWTFLAFALLILAFVSPNHPFVSGGGMGP